MAVIRQTDVEQPQRSKAPPPPSWSSIPNKFQLGLICSVRIVDFFQQAALQAYMYHQLRSFSPDALDSEISFQCGVLQGVFTLAQVFTGVLWGRIADSSRFGRKWVIIFGLVGQGISCMGVAFSGCLLSAAIWRCLGGAVNATVGGARTVLAESTDKRYHSRTFLLLPLAWNIANIFGPIFGGLFSDPVENYPDWFGEDSPFGGPEGSDLLREFPYAPPNLMCAFILFADAALIWVGLRETLVTIKFNRDRGIEFGETMAYNLRRIFFPKSRYRNLGDSQGLHAPETAVDDDDDSDSDSDEGARNSSSSSSSNNNNNNNKINLNEPTSMPLTPLQDKLRDKLQNAGNKVEDEVAAASVPAKPSPPITQAFTLNVLMVLATVALMDFQMGGFTSLWIIFLSSSTRTDAKQAAVQLPFHFTGGIGFSPGTVGIAMSILGFVGILLQFTLYPSVNARFGLLRSTQWSLFVFPIAYAIAPFLSLLVRAPILLWFGIVLVVLLQVAARTFAVPGSVLLINNSSPSPQLLGTIHGMGAATSSAFRTIGPIAAGYWYSQGLESGVVGYGWWMVAAMALLGVLPSFWAKDGN